MLIQKESYAQKDSDKHITFGELYAEISRDRESRAARLQERRWHKLNSQLGLS